MSISVSSAPRRGGAVLGGHNALTGRPEGMPIIARMARQYLGRPASPRRLALSGCSARRASCTTTSRHRRLMTRWSTRSWPPLTVSELVGVLWVFGRASRKWSPAPCDVCCALYALCCVTVIKDVRCVLNACIDGSSHHILCLLCVLEVLLVSTRFFFTSQERES